MVQHHIIIIIIIIIIENFISPEINLPFYWKYLIVAFLQFVSILCQFWEAVEIDNTAVIRLFVKNRKYVISKINLKVFVNILINSLIRL